MLITNLKSGCLPRPQIQRVRRVYFAFDYQYDIERVRKIRNIPNVLVNTVAGLADDALWQRLSQRGEYVVKSQIEGALENTSVTVVCIGAMSAYCRYIDYTIERSLEMAKGILGIHISHLRDEQGHAAEKGRVPWLLKISGFRVYDYVDPEQLATRIEEADRLGSREEEINALPSL